MTPTTMTPTTMTPTTIVDGTGVIDVALCWVYSRVMREGLTCCKLKPKQSWLAEVLILESYDRLDESGLAAPVLRGKLALKEWAERGGFRDEKGLRTKTLEGVLRSLVTLGLVDVNWMESTFELRPAASSWDTSVGLRAKPRPVCVKQQVMEFSAERPLSAALADLSREKALTGAGVATSDSRALFNRLRVAVNDPLEMAALQEDLARMARAPASGDLPDDVGGKIRRMSAEKFADTGNGEKPADLQGFAASAEKFAESVQAEAVSAVPASVQKAVPANGSAEKFADAMAWLKKKDAKGRLQDVGIFAQWSELCERNPRYVLDRLRWHLQYYQDRTARNNEPPLEDPLAWMSRKARDERQLKRLNLK